MFYHLSSKLIKQQGSVKREGDISLRERHGTARLSRRQVVRRARSRVRFMVDIIQNKR